jgi:hypothetical protein
MFVKSRSRSVAFWSQRRPQERISLVAILAACTKNTAWAAREDGIDGSIERWKGTQVSKTCELFQDRDVAHRRQREYVTTWVPFPSPGSSPESDGNDIPVSVCADCDVAGECFT